jgi:hypothetical protein
MITFTKPTNLNGAELRDELNAAGVIISYESGAVGVDGNNDLWLDINPADKAKAEAVVAAHNGTMVAPDTTIEDKLSSVGLNLDDLKAALGL